MAKVELKQPVVKEISAAIEGAQSVVLVDHRGLTVQQDTELRKQLREAGVTYKVYKNTMMNFAFKGTDCEGLSDLLNGPSALAVSKDDATAPARILCEFAKKADKLEIKGGVVEGKVVDPEGLGEVAKIPTREVLLGRLFGSWQAPISSFARVIKQIADQADRREGWRGSSCRGRGSRRGLISAGTDSYLEVLFQTNLHGGKYNGKVNKC